MVPSSSCSTSARSRPAPAAREVRPALRRQGARRPRHGCAGRHARHRGRARRRGGGAARGDHELVGHRDRSVRRCRGARLAVQGRALRVGMEDVLTLARGVPVEHNEQLVSRAGGARSGGPAHADEHRRGRACSASDGRGCRLPGRSAAAWPYCSRVEDLQRPPADGDRERVVARINRVHDEGRISTADRDIRLGNVRSAQSMAELDLMSRDLDQLEAALPLERLRFAVRRLRPRGRWTSTRRPSADSKRSRWADRARPSRSSWCWCWSGWRRCSWSATASPVLRRRPERVTRAPADPATDEPATPPDTDPEVDPPAGPAYSLSAGGIRGFLATYRKKFGTSRVVDLTFTATT